MKIHDQNNAQMEPLARKLKGQRVAMLTLREEDGLNSRPMTPLEMDGEGCIWFMASRRSMHSGREPGGEAVNLAFVAPDDGDYISIAGAVTLVDDAERKQELWTLAARPWFDGPQDPDLVLLRVQPAKAEIWDGPDSALSRLLGMAASVVAQREVGLGHKEVITPGSAQEASPRPA
jgi:general stress protein 26